MCVTRVCLQWDGMACRDNEGDLGLDHLPHGWRPSQSEIPSAAIMPDEVRDVGERISGDLGIYCSEFCNRIHYAEPYMVIRT